jgi:hypothetical protein
MYKKTSFAALLLLSCSGCPKTPPPEPPIVVTPPYTDAGAEGAVFDDCGLNIDPLCRAACESLAKVGCPESAPTGGRTCSCMCTKAVEEGLDLNTVCVAAASTPDQIRQCGPACEGR